MNALEIKNIIEHISPIERNYKKGEYIYHEADKISTIGLVLLGNLLIIKEDYWGNRTIISEVTEGQLFGESYACSEEKILSVNVVAKQNTTVVYFDVNKIFAMCSLEYSYNKKLIQNLVTVLAEKNIHLTNKIEYMSYKKIRDRILLYLSDMSKKARGEEFTIPFNRQELADYLSVDRSALSNQLSHLREEGILDFNKNKFKLIKGI